jgi:hypothetical protein
MSDPLRWRANYEPIEFDNRSNEIETNAGVGVLTEGTDVKELTDRAFVALRAKSTGGSARR